MARPLFKPTTTQRRKVSIAAAGGTSHSDIAQMLGIAQNTLYRHFEIELSVGATRRRQDLLEAMYRAGMKGNVVAQRTFLSLTPTYAPPPVPKEARRGKKAQAAIDATTATVGTEWDVLLNPPKALQ